MTPQASADYYRAQQKITTAVLLAARRIWGVRPPKDFDSWFAANVDRLITIVTAGQARAVEGADDYVTAVLDELGTPVAAEVIPATEPLVGVASDGRPLDSLMYGAIITTKGKIVEADTYSPDVLAQAWQSGLNALMLRTQQQIADASRVATSLSIAARPGVGYVRMLNPPSCSRCAVLAGRFYRWNQGFRRHPGCDCRHIPSREDSARDLRTDPGAYFASLPEDLQNKIFTMAGAEAIRDGADINHVVNARRGMSTAQENVAGWIPKGRLQTRSLYGQEMATTIEGVTRRGEAYRAMSRAGYAQRETDVRAGRNFRAKAPRLMPESIYEIAEDRDDALRLLRLNGYLSDRERPVPSRASVRGRPTPTAPSPSSSGGGRVPPRPPIEDSPVPSDDDGELLASHFDESFADWAAGLSNEQRLAIVQWQRADDRFYQRIQKALRTGVEDAEAEQVSFPILDAIAAGVLDQDVATWRGIRNTTPLFGVSRERLADLTGEVVDADGFLAVSTSKAIAVDEFTKPSFGGGSALLRVHVQAGMPAAWVKLVGDPRMEYQRELLLPPGHLLRVLEVSYTGDLPLVDVEVI
ncbi:hypothetical protein JWS13_39115 [Rhodococcus pseudokoreensis]|uniref:ADP-ribosyltransferase exoenzyme n=1 Tax=Rhodococcus pseudokoreensis TaxID=2811421 RepID=A0A974WCH3_9NOCA|nr:hypothetical protein [Rhodococcus pseudokoreensis]QSE94188.1 hypothetical protein JWS13_39115 [Rhodococcus pseudokoreensis]